jgi:type I restriction enzyme R subunit
VVGSEKRLRIVAKDLIDHWEKRNEAIEGKAMIVCMSRRICADMYRIITELKPEWHDKEDNKGTIKVVMTGSASDSEEWQAHVRTKARREELAKRFKDPKDPFKIVIVRDMWLTGFDAPSLHTMYVDKPMHSHTLMQAIARVNRVYKDKPGGLIVDYLGIADELRRAMANYTESGGTGNTAVDQEVAVKVLLEKYEICRDMYHGFNYTAWKTGDLVQKLNLLPQAQEHILQQDDGKRRYMNVVSELTKAFALSVPHDSAMKIRDDVGFYQAVRTALTKQDIEGEEVKHDLQDAAIRQLVSRAVSSDKIIDIFAATGLKRPDVSILSDEFLNEVKKVPQKNLAIETLKKLLSDEIKTHSRKNLVQSKKFSEMLEDTINKYRKKVISSIEVLNALFGLATEMRESYKKGEELGLSVEEMAFYDALEVNDSAVKLLGDEVLRDIALELVTTVRKNVSIDWTVKENVRAKLRVMIKRVLRKHGYPPDKQEKATETVLSQAELLAEDWVEA